MRNLNVKRFKPISILVLTSLLLVLFSSLANATVRTVCASGCDYTTIQGGIDASSTGDIVMVREGTYNEVIDFKGKAIEVTGTACPEKTIIDGTGKSDSVVTFTTSEGSSSIIKGFTIQNGLVTSGSGGGIVCSQTSPTIDDCIITSNAARYGAGIYSYGGSPTIKNTKITDNTTFSPGYGGGIYLGYSSSPTITDCEVTDNYGVTFGGGFYLTMSADPDISDTIISGNDNYTGGGGIFSTNSSTATLTRCTIQSNSTQGLGGGIYTASGSGAFTITDSFIDSNTARTGGGIFMKRGITITGSTISNNEASATGTNYGGGISGDIYADLDMTDCTVTGNDGGSSGGGLHFYNCTYAQTIESSTISNNTAGNGGGLYITGADVDITNSVISGNDASSEYGGGLYANGGSLDITNGTIANNSADYGGGGMYTGIPTTVINSIFWGNTATYGPEAWTSNSTSKSITYSDIDTSEVYTTGTAVTYSDNIDADPLFNKDEDIPDEEKDDYYIITDSDRTEYSGDDSPCIDEASATYAPADDRVGITRPQGSADDIGAYENND